MNYIIKHPKAGVYIEHVWKPRFTWRFALMIGKRFFTMEEAQAVLKKSGMERCTIEPDNLGRIR